MVNQKFLSTTWHGCTKTKKSTPLLSLHPKVFIAIGKRRRSQPTCTTTLNVRFMFGIRTRTRLRKNTSYQVSRSVVSSASCWSTWRDLQQQNSKRSWRSLFETRLSYLRLMSQQLLRTRKPRGLRLWLHLVKQHRIGVYLQGRPLRNRRWIYTHNVDSWTKPCLDSSRSIRFKGGMPSHAHSAWVGTASSKSSGTEISMNLAPSSRSFRIESQRTKLSICPTKSTQSGTSA